MNGYRRFFLRFHSLWNGCIDALLKRPLLLEQAHAQTQASICNYTTANHIYLFWRWLNDCGFLFWSKTHPFQFWWPFWFSITSDEWNILDGERKRRCRHYFTRVLVLPWPLAAACFLVLTTEPRCLHKPWLCCSLPDMTQHSLKSEISLVNTWNKMCVKRNKTKAHWR